MFRLRLSLVLLLGLFLVACGGGGKEYTGDDVIAAFKAAGLEAEDVHPMGVDDYGLAPYRGTGTRFYTPSLCEDKCSGRIIITDNDEDKEVLLQYYEGLPKASAALFTWVTSRDNIILQLNGDIPEEEFRKYEAALNAME